MNNASVLFLLFPDVYLPEYIKGTKDIYEQRSLLKQLLISELRFPTHAVGRA